MSMMPQEWRYCNWLLTTLDGPVEAPTTRQHCDWWRVNESWVNRCEVAFAWPADAPPARFPVDFAGLAMYHERDDEQPAHVIPMADLCAMADAGLRRVTLPADSGPAPSPA